MKINCKLLIDFNDTKKAESVLKSVSVDDFNYINSKISKTTLQASIKTDSIPSLIHTLDDYLSCVSVANKIVDKN